MTDYLQNEATLAAIGEEYGRRIRRSPFKGTNFITSAIVGVFHAENGRFFELSTGQGISGGTIYGVTAADAGREKDDSLSACCHDFREVRAAVEAIAADN